jgi:hypothetical protein
MILKNLAFNPLGYVRDKMNVFDGTIVTLSIVDLSNLIIKLGMTYGATNSGVNL